MIKLPRLLSVAAWSAMAALSAAPALAADYPNKPVRLVVPTAAGGSLDTLARLLGSRLEAKLGQPFVVENRPGSNGNTAFEYVSKASHDGYTLLVASDALAINPSLYKNVRYDPVNGFAPVSLVTTAAQILVTRPNLGAGNLQQFLAIAREKGKKLTVASPGSGSAGHLSAVLLQSQTQTSWTHVAYKGGGPAVADLVGGHVDALFVTLAPAVPQVKAGALKAIAVTTPTRSQALPDVPSIAESGVAGFDVTNWQGVFAPAGTPSTIVEPLSGAIQAIVQEPEIRQRLVDLGFDPVSGGPQVLGTHVRDNVAKWAKVIPQANITVD
ncbi:tripartite-type tricarboxylate transporter receptor subunit TctC [Comamonas sp. BIGb0124]|uniref:tripartite tricarboxylate transporter substrate binding protein n=1 Tax=Comamonas sp. BIGb0124 TaxID=2485130 RepID=UPI000F483E55|nr:tripartite tricarboxylate transporter substrate binding protein [Comamonas sp. BIGb0124]ROR24582.1 tripartite-type tricarboxylate transporter receptor subunit TctC [Comamonas sp. BIGb0124]